MGKRKGRQREDDSSSSDASSSDGMSTEETRSSGNHAIIKAIRKTISKEAKGTKRMFEELKDEMSGIKKQLKKHNENHIILCRLSDQLNGSSGDVSPAPRSEPNQMQPPRFRLRITSKVKDKVGKGESILTEHGDLINIVLYDGGNVIANDHPLASASVMMVVLTGEFNKGDNKYNWSKEDFQKSIRRPREGNSATGDVNRIIESTVSGGTFNLAGGSCNHRDAKISENSSNKKVRLGVMVVSQTEERVLEGLSNHFLVRDPTKKSKPATIDGSSTPQNNTEQASGSSTPENNTHGAHLQCLQQPSSYTGGCYLPDTLYLPPANLSLQASNVRGSDQLLPGLGDFVADSEHMSMLRPVQPLWDWPAGDLGGFEEYIIRPVQLLWDRPDVEPSKRWNLLDQLMPLYSRQPKIHSGDFPTMRLMPEHYDSPTTYPQGPYQRLFLMKMMRNLQITTVPKEVMQTHRNRGVLIQPLEPDDSDDEPLLKRKLHNKYQLRFVNKVCGTYYTWEQIKADDGNLLNVALYDENNSKITSGPLSSASVEVVVLHGDFNANGQDYWTSEEFSSCVVRAESGKGRSVLGGDRVLVLVDGEASVGFAFFEKTSSFARTGKFKMGVKMKITIEERIQEGISESFFVTSRRGKGLNSNSKPPLIKSPITTRELLEEGFTTLKGCDSDIFAKLKAEDMEQVAPTPDAPAPPRLPAAPTPQAPPRRPSPDALPRHASPGPPHLPSSAPAPPQPPTPQLRPAAPALPRSTASPTPPQLCPAAWGSVLDSGSGVLWPGFQDPVPAGRRTTTGRDERLRRALAAFGGGSDVWELVDAALASAARDRPDELRARPDDIVERLYAGGSSGSCSTCDAPPPPPAAAVAEEETPAPASPEAEGDADADGMGEAEELGDAGDGELGLESKILAIKDFLEDPDQLEDEVASSLQSLADMDITYKALQETDIGRHVNGLRKHPSGEVRRLVKQLIRKWKEIVDNWVCLHNSSGDGGSSIITDGDSPEKIHVKNHQSAKVIKSSSRVESLGRRLAD